MGKRQSTFFFSEGQYGRALQGLYDGLAGPEAFMTLMGGAGTGKSTLCQKLHKYMRVQGHRVISFESAVESPDMLRSLLARDLDLPDSVNFARLMEDSLAGSIDKPLILIFDDAHQLSDITLIEILRLAEVQIDHRPVVNVLLSGDSALHKRLTRKNQFKSLSQRISHSFMLGPMERDALAQFVAAMMESAGWPGLEWEQAALTALKKATRGYPQPATAVCQALIETRRKQPNSGIEQPVTREELAGLLSSLPGRKHFATNVFRSGEPAFVLGPVFAVLVIASLGLIYRQLNLSPVPAAIDGQGTLAVAEQPADSPFTLAEPRETQALPVETMDTAASEALSQEPAAPATEPQAVVEVSVPAFPEETHTAVVAASQVANPAVAPVPVSEAAHVDSGLRLVTAAERGVQPTLIEDPVYEFLAAVDGEKPAQAAWTVDPPPAQEASSVPSGLTPAIDGTSTEPFRPPAREAAYLPGSNPTVVSDDSIPQPAGELVSAGPRLVDPLAAVSESREAMDAGAASPGAQQPDEEMFAQLVQQWTDDWAGQVLDAYFAHYHPDFVPRYHGSYDEWRDNRRRVIGNANWIELQVRDLEVIDLSEDQSEVHFWLDYQSSSYQDSTLKKLNLTRLADRWMITAEINLEVRN